MSEKRNTEDSDRTGTLSVPTTDLMFLLRFPYLARKYMTLLLPPTTTSIVSNAVVNYPVLFTMSGSLVLIREE